MKETKSIRYISGFLGISMFMFGVLKFVDPFKAWYAEQIASSQLPFPSYALGIAGEIAIGAGLLFVFFKYQSLDNHLFKRMVEVTSVFVILMMVVAFYVHLHPDVSHEVLPLKIRPPFIPGSFLLLAATNFYLSKKSN